jgi:hypothetical protein
MVCATTFIGLDLPLADRNLQLKCLTCDNTVDASQLSPSTAYKTNFGLMRELDRRHVGPPGLSCPYPLCPTTGLSQIGLERHLRNDCQEWSVCCGSCDARHTRGGRAAHNVVCRDLGFLGLACGVCQQRHHNGTPFLRIPCGFCAEYPLVCLARQHVLEHAQEADADVGELEARLDVARTKQERVNDVLASIAALGL